MTTTTAVRVTKPVTVPHDGPVLRRRWAVIAGATNELGGPVAATEALFPYDEPWTEGEIAAANADGTMPIDAVGYVDTYTSARQTVVHEVYVVAEYQRRGVGSALLAAAGKRERLRHRGLTDAGSALWAARVGDPKDGYLTA